MIEKNSDRAWLEKTPETPFSELSDVAKEIRILRLIISDYIVLQSTPQYFIRGNCWHKTGKVKK